MSTVAIVGGGPAGLSAALFTAKNGLETHCYDTDETWVHKAHLYNYPGIRSIGGSEFMEVTRGQVQDRGATLHETEVSSVSAHEDGFTVEPTEGDSLEATYVVFATGTDTTLPEETGCLLTEDETVEVSLSMETTVSNAFATGALIRDQEWQAVISAGDGAVAALAILGRERGEHFHDFDTPDDVPKDPTASE